MITALALLCASCAPLPDAEPIKAVCTVTDGDTLRCGDERIRLLGIDAPEMAGHCRQGRDCVPGDPKASAAHLREAVGGQQLTIRRLGKDRYGRTLGVVEAGGVNLSCAQLEAGSAIYRRDWDNRQAIARSCPTLAR